MTLAVAGALVIAGLGLAISLAGTMVRPVHALTAATARIASGDFEAQAEVLSHEEIGLLATEFNRMAEHIRHLRRLIWAKRWWRSRLPKRSLTPL